MKEKKTTKAKLRSAVKDLTARKAAPTKGKHGTGGGAGKVNVQDLSFTHYVDG